MTAGGDCALGLDFGTSSVRAVLVALDTGAEAGRAEWRYPHGDGGVIGSSDPNLARQDPRDWLAGTRAVVPAALAQAQGRGTRGDCRVVAIGVDATGSTPVPVGADGSALAEHESFAGDLDALAWLWKDHTAHAEAVEITARARDLGLRHLGRSGGAYSAEWFWSKVLHLKRCAPRTFAAAAGFVEQSDFVPAWLCGERAPGRVVRNACAAGHKGMYAADLGGWPEAGFWARLDPELAALRTRMNERVATAEQRRGGLARDVAAELGLEAGTPVAVGALDAHLGAVGAGIAAGELVKVIGTSTCDMAVGTRDREIPSVEGLAGVADGSILPGLLGYEAGQSAVGDIFDWCARVTGGRDQGALSDAASALRPGASGLLALDWHNGNRCILADAELSGLVLGLNLHTREHELYRAMLEATAFGARVILERFEQLAVPVRALLACGGIAQKNPLLLQIYADVLGRPIAVAGASEASALGAAIVGAVAAGRFASMAQAQRRLCPPRAITVQPDPDRTSTYARLYALYRRLHDAFGAVRHDVDLTSVMKELLAIRATARAGG